MPPTTRYRRGDLVVSFPFTDLTSSKRRPAMIRRNQIVLGSDPAGGTVSRMHARIHGTRKDETIVFTLFDDGSQRGSMVVRGGVPHTVMRGPSGVRLRDGDEVYFGKVKMAFRLR